MFVRASCEGWLSNAKTPDVSSPTVGKLLLKRCKIQSIFASYDLMLSCWSLDPDERPRFYELVELVENGLKEVGN